MKLLKYLGGLLLAMFFLSPTTTALSAVTGLSPAAATGVVMAVAFFAAYTSKTMPGLYMCDPIQRELFRGDIIENLFKDDKFATRAYNADSFVKDGLIVHIPTAGTPQRSKKNIDTFPQTATKRADGSIMYELDVYYILPRRIPALDKYQYTYDTRMSVIGDDIRQHSQDVNEGLLYRWAPGASNIIETTGAATAAMLSGATGNRKKFTKDIFGKVDLAMNRANILKTGRVALLTADHLQQLWDDLSEGEKTNFNAVADLANGVIGRYRNFDIMDRSTVLRYNGTTAVDELDEDFEAGEEDCGASLFWQVDCVERAVGTIEVFDNPGRVEYYGDTFSAFTPAGGRIRREAGVWAVVEAATA